MNISSKKLKDSVMKSLRLHIVIAGYTQTKSGWNGPATLREELAEEVSKLGSHRRVWLQHWNDRWPEIAERFRWLGLYYKREVRVGIYAYSWGAGWGAMRLSRHLNDLGLGVEHMVLCDPVYRHHYPWGNWRAYANHPALSWICKPVISVPPNVKEVHSFHQTTDYPRGHKLVAESEQTIIHPSVHLNCKHMAMDERVEWRNKSIEQALSL